MVVGAIVSVQVGGAFAVTKFNEVGALAWCSYACRGQR